jgi:hypothetical protein
MKNILHLIHRKSFSTLTAGLAVAMLLGAGANVGRAQALPSGVQDVVKLTQAGIADDVILSQIRNNQATYSLTADQIIALKNQGVSQPVIKALIAGGSAGSVTTPAPVAIPTPSPAPAPVVETPVASAPAVSFESFQTQLAPSGSWIEVPGSGLCWQPTIAVSDPNWRPYFDHGHWIYTDAGWSWQSDYTWGNIVFHYGRWQHFNARWVWVPGYDYAPAWVCWREADGYCGWAPLPPAAVYKAGVGLYFNGAVALDVDFGLGIDAFAFVAYDHFWDLDYRPFWLPRERLELVFHGSRIMNGYRMDHGHFVMEGLGHDHMAALTHRDVRVERDFHDARPAGHGIIDDRNSHNDRRDPHSW